MFIGHYGAAFVAATLPRAPRLGALFVAAQLIDFGFFGLMLAGVEHMRLAPGITRMNAMDLYDMPWTHSLFGTLCWAAGFAGLIWLWRRSGIAALIGAAVVFSHWLFDLLVHRPDLTIAGSPPALGLGLWNRPGIEIPLELACAFGGLAFFVWRTRSTSLIGWLSVAVLAIAMTVVQAVNWFGEQPDIVNARIPLTALAAYAVLSGIAWWVAHTRPLRS